MPSRKELTDGILAIRKRNSPPLSTLKKPELAALLAKLKGGSETPKSKEKKPETPKAKDMPAPAPAAKKSSELDKYIIQFKKELKDLYNLSYVLDHDNYGDRYSGNIVDNPVQRMVDNENDIKLSKWYEVVKEMYVEKFGDLPDSIEEMLYFLKENNKIEYSYGRLSDSSLATWYSIVVKIIMIADKTLSGKQNKYREFIHEEHVIPPYGSDIDEDEIRQFFKGYFVFPLYLEGDVETVEYREQEVGESDNVYENEKEYYEEDQEYDYTVSASFEITLEGAKKIQEKKKMKADKLAKKKAEEEEEQKIKEAEKIETRRKEKEDYQALLDREIVKIEERNITSQNVALDKLKQRKIDLEDEIATAIINLHISTTNLERLREIRDAKKK